MVLGALVLGIVALWLAGSARPHRAPARPLTPPPPRPVPRTAPERDGSPQPDVIGGWLFGHHIAHGHDGFPGDPLPHGHLGSAADLAFWGSVFDEEDED